jgi:hypothetical protein
MEEQGVLWVPAHFLLTPDDEPEKYAHMERKCSKATEDIIKNAVIMKTVTCYGDKNSLWMTSHPIWEVLVWVQTKDCSRSPKQVIVY